MRCRVVSGEGFVVIKSIKSGRQAMLDYSLKLVLCGLYRQNKFVGISSFVTVQVPEHFKLKSPKMFIYIFSFMVENNEYTKNDSIFTFPMESLQFQSNVIYDLYGIVIHRGNMNFGHYIAIVKNCLTGR